MKIIKSFKHLCLLSLSLPLFVGLVGVNANDLSAVHADANPTISLGEFDASTKTFKNATATENSNTFKYVDVFLCNELSDSDNVTVPSLTGYFVNKENLYNISIEIENAKTAKSIMEDCISKIQFNVNEKQAIRVTLQNTPGASDANHFYFAENDHYYSFVSFPDEDEGPTEDWFTSYDKAKEMTYMGRTGYLATITSLEEDIFIYKASGRKVGWLGGTTLKPTTKGEEGSLYNTYSTFEQSNYAENHFTYWTWACGPEKDQQFFDLDNGDPCSTDIDYERNSANNYINWDAAYGEPNNPLEEDCLTTLCIGEGYSTHTLLTEKYSWNNLRCTARKEKGDYRDDYVSNGFVVEFGDKAVGDSNSTTSASVTTIGYTDNSHIDNVSSISIKTTPTKLNFTKGEDLDVTGGTINVNYESGNVEIVNITNDMVSGYDKENVGSQTLTITYFGKTTSFTIQVTNNGNTGNDKKGLNPGAVVAIVFASLLFLLLVLLIVLYILWKLKDFKLIKFLVGLFRKVNKLLFRTPLNDVEKKEAEEKQMTDEEYLEYLKSK